MPQAPLFKTQGKNGWAKSPEQWIAVRRRTRVLNTRRATLPRSKPRWFPSAACAGVDRLKGTVSNGVRVISTWWLTPLDCLSTPGFSSVLLSQTIMNAPSGLMVATRLKDCKALWKSNFKREDWFEKQSTRRNRPWEETPSVKACPHYLVTGRKEQIKTLNCLKFEIQLHLTLQILLRGPMGLPYSWVRSAMSQ